MSLGQMINYNELIPQDLTVVTLHTDGLADSRLLVITCQLDGGHRDLKVDDLRFRGQPYEGCV